MDDGYSAENAVWTFNGWIKTCQKNGGDEEQPIPGTDSVLGTELKDSGNIYRKNLFAFQLIKKKSHIM